MPSTAAVSSARQGPGARRRAAGDTPKPLGSARDPRRRVCAARVREDEVRSENRATVLTGSVTSVAVVAAWRGQRQVEVRWGRRGMPSSRSTTSWVEPRPGGTLKVRSSTRSSADGARRRVRDRRQAVTWAASPRDARSREPTRRGCPPARGVVDDGEGPGAVDLLAVQPGEAPLGARGVSGTPETVHRVGDELACGERYGTWLPRSAWWSRRPVEHVVRGAAVVGREDDGRYRLGEVTVTSRWAGVGLRSGSTSTTATSVHGRTRPSPGRRLASRDSPRDQYGAGDNYSGPGRPYGPGPPEDDP